VSSKVDNYLIFTDLDDTLLDNSYEYKDAIPTLDILKEKKIPIVCCSAKTFTEQNIFIKAMEIEYPFIVEGGSAIFIPRGCFKQTTGKRMGDYEVIVLGVEFGAIKKEIESLRKNCYIKSYLSMSVEEVAKQMELDLEGAERAKNSRQFTETIIEADENALEALRRKFNVVRGGRAIEVCGKGADKGRAVEILTDLYKKEQGNLVTIGLGNSYNDEAMLRVVDIPVLVRNPDGNWADISIDRLYKAQGIGPRGWGEAIDKFVLGKES